MNREQQKELIGTDKSIYEQVIELNIEHDHYYSDLYIPVNDTTRDLVASYGHTIDFEFFSSNIDGKLWYDIPFSYDPYWQKLEKNNGG